MSYDGVTPTPGGLEYSQFIKDITLLRKNYKPDATLPPGYMARKTAILFNPVNVMAIDQNRQTTEWNTTDHFLKYYKALKSFGAPVDFIRDNADFNAFPVLVVPAYQQIDKDLITRLTGYVNQGGNLVMTCRTGHQDHNGHLWEAPFARPIYELIGAEIEFYDLLMPHSPDSVKFKGKSYAWTSWGEILKPGKKTETWATYSGDFYSGKPAVISRQAGKGTVTYVGVDSRDGLLEKAVMTTLFSKIKIPVSNYPEGIMVEYRDGFGIAVNYSDKAFNMDLPSGSEILIGKKSVDPVGVLVWKY